MFLPCRIYWEKKRWVGSNLLHCFSSVTTRCGSVLESVSLVASRINVILNQIDTNHYFGVKCWIGLLPSFLVEMILTEASMKPFICQLIANLGRLLLLVDTVFAGELREKLLVLYYRLIVVFARSCYD